MADSKKDATKGVATVALTYATTGSALAAALTSVPTLVGLGWEKIAGRAKGRAQRLYQRMLEVDEDPAQFAEHLKSDREDVLTALRALITASVDAISPAAIEPIALIGREYLRDRCPGFLARGWLRILTELTESEIAELRELVQAACEARAEYYERIRLSNAEPVKPHIRVKLYRSSPPSHMMLPELNIAGAIFVRQGERPRHVVLASRPAEE